MLQRSPLIASLVLLTWGLTITAFAQAQEDLAWFSITPSEPGIAAGSGFKGDKFTFSAYAPGAECFELELTPETNDRGDSLKKIAKSNNGQVEFTHVFEKVAKHMAILRAYLERNCDDAVVRREANPVRIGLYVDVKPPPVIAEAAASKAQFLVTLSDPDDPTRWNEFTFTADVSQARSYVLYADARDRSAPKQVRPGIIGAAMRVPHRYDREGKYTAVLQAERTTGETVEISQVVSVTRPPAPPQPAGRQVNASQWPAATATTSELPKPEESDALLWLLILAGAVAAVGSLSPGIAATDVLKFVPTKDRGRFDVTSPQEHADLLSTRVWWRNPPHFKLSDNAAVIKSRSMLKRPGR